MGRATGALSGVLGLTLLVIVMVATGICFLFFVALCIVWPWLAPFYVGVFGLAYLGLRFRKRSTHSSRQVDEQGFFDHGEYSHLPSALD